MALNERLLQIAQAVQSDPEDEPDSYCEDWDD